MDLPISALVEVATFLDAKDLSRGSIVCSLWKSTFCHSLLWQSLCEKHSFKSLTQATRTRGNQKSWRQIYLENICINCKGDESRITIDLGGGSLMRRNLGGATSLISICLQCFNECKQIKLSARMKNKSLLAHARKCMGENMFTSLLTKIPSEDDRKQRKNDSYSNRYDNPHINDSLVPSIRQQKKQKTQ